MSMQIFRRFKVTIPVFLLLVPIGFPLQLSQDTLKAIENKKFLEYGADLSNKSLPDISLANPRGPIALAQLEHEMHLMMLKKISFGNHGEENEFTRALLEYVEDYRATAGSLMQSSMDIESSVASVAGNMIAVYRMVRRFRNYIQPWILEQKKGKALSFQTEVLEAMNPSGKSLDLFSNDFHLSLLPIIATQFNLDWKAKDICKGAVEGMELGSTFKAVHCLEIGVHAIASGMYPIGIEWIEEAISKAALEIDTSANLQLIATDVLERAYAKHDERWRPQNLENLEETFYVTRLNDSVNVKDGNLTRQWRVERECTDTDPEPTAQDMEIFPKMCQGKLEQPEHIKPKLFCWLETSVHPTWKIGPLKVELLSALPDDVVLFHDVISKSLTEDFIEYGKPRRKPGVKNTANVPFTQLSFGCRVVDPTLQHRLDGLTERMTGLRTEDALLNFVAYYPPGGHLNLHTDNMGSEGDYNEFITTVLYYFAPPELGGGTVITHSQVHIKPPAGSAVFWYFTYKSGALREGRAHGACPVAKGQKWINVKGLHYLKQTHLVCDMDEHARFEYLVNGKSKYRRLSY